MQRKAIALLSGGLDSTLAVKVMLDQGIAVEALNFTSPFCNCTGKNSGCKSEAVRVAEEFKIPIKVMHKGADYLEIIREATKKGSSGITKKKRLVLKDAISKYVEESTQTEDIYLNEASVLTNQGEQISVPFVKLVQLGDKEVLGVGNYEEDEEKEDEVEELSGEEKPGERRAYSVEYWAKEPGDKKEKNAGGFD